MSGGFSALQGRRLRQRDTGVINQGSDLVVWLARIASAMLAAAIYWDVRSDVRRLVSARNVVLMGLYVWYLLESLQGEYACRAWGDAAYAAAAGTVVLAGVFFLLGYHALPAGVPDPVIRGIECLNSWTILRRVLLVGTLIGAIPLLVYGVPDAYGLWRSLFAMRQAHHGPLYRSHLGDFRGAVLLLETFLYGLVWIALLVLSHPHRTRWFVVLAVIVVGWSLLRAYGSGTRYLMLQVLVPIAAWLYWQAGAKWQRIMLWALLPSFLGIYRLAGAIAEGRQKGQVDFRVPAQYYGHEMFRELEFIQARIPATQSYLYGRTLAVELINPIPRFLWPGKPYGFGIEYAAWHGVDSFRRDWTMSPGILGEMYANFGYAGIAFLNLLGGVLCRAWDRFGASRASSLPVWLCYACGLCVLLLMGRSISVHLLYPMLSSLLCLAAVLGGARRGRLSVSTKDRQVVWT